MEFTIEGNRIILEDSTTSDTKPLVRPVFHRLIEKMFEEVFDDAKGEDYEFVEDDFALPFYDALTDYLASLCVGCSEELIHDYGLANLLHFYCLKGNTLSFDERGNYCKELVEFMMISLFREIDIDELVDVVRAMKQIEGEFGGFEWEGN
jgi:hypothetical protein